MSEKYYFSVLRYTFDAVTQEFVNIGLVLYVPGSRFIHARCTNHYSRVSKMFRRIDGNAFRSLTRYVQDRINQLHGEMDKGALFFDPDEKLEALLARILPDDDSAIRFASAGVGVTENPKQSFEALYERYVSRYESSQEAGARNDDDVWRVFYKPLERKNITARLTPKKIVAPNYEYEFQRTWKNSAYHIYEPVSFDLTDPTSIVDKANRWLGRGMSLAKSNENFKLFLLLGQPSEQRLLESFHHAQNILHEIPGSPELIQEQDAERFAEDVERELTEHDANRME